jgi:5'-phosphate synthase pdxT subunit
MKIGILALQGDFDKHASMIDTLGATPMLVRQAPDLDSCDGLILPGGESTTLSRLMDKHSLRDAIIRFGRQKPVYGTCAGMILLASQLQSSTNGVYPLDLINITVERNAYGRQLDSFIADVQLEFAETTSPFSGVFIRAPKIIDMGQSVTVLGRYQDTPVLVQSGQVLASAFHPELTDDDRIHRFFIKIVESVHSKTR